ncbi:MAG: cysteine desulfurase [Parcubacteria group bacterium LiPW_15]|nr:MAG: cysteine desulfurase [Parcubacteria group bacterium LiPW_15]
MAYKVDMKRYYFDYAASAPVDKKVLGAMLPYFSEKFGNAGSLHSFGQEAITAVDKARDIIARELGADFRQIIFTGSATEANNLAIKGAFLGAKKYFKKNGIKGKPKIIVSAIEHESVLESARALLGEGAEVVCLPVDKNGFVREEILREKLDERTAVVSVMLGNNEIGTIQPVAKFAEIISEFKKNSKFYTSGSTFYPLFHTDAAQAFQYIDCNVSGLGIDLMTLSSQKIYGPKGAGVLYIKERSGLEPIISGGAQEFGLRSGTENVAAIVGFGEAVKITTGMRAKEAERVEGLKAYFLGETKKAIPNVSINGTANKKQTLPHVANINLPGRRAEELLTRLDLAGFAVSAGSACRSRSAEPSHVILALGYSEERARGSLRISFGRDTKKPDILKLIKEIKKYERKN